MACNPKYEAGELFLFFKIFSGFGRKLVLLVTLAGGCLGARASGKFANSSTSSSFHTKSCLYQKLKIMEGEWVDFSFQILIDFWKIFFEKFSKQFEKISF